MLSAESAVKRSGKAAPARSIYLLRSSMVLRLRPAWLQSQNDLSRGARNVSVIFEFSTEYRTPSPPVSQYRL